jgi:4-carboxymuconolactone decarboxylase
MPMTGLRQRPIQPTEPTQRIDSRPMTEMRQEWLQILGRIPGTSLKGDGFPRNALGVLLHNPDVFGPFLDYWVTCKRKMHISVREQELVILRMGCLFRSDYVFKHHVSLAREFGVSEAELQAVRDGCYDDFVPREAAMLTLTDEFMDTRTLSAATWTKYNTTLSATEVIDLIGLVSQYVLFGLVNNVAQVQVEAPIVAVPGIDG